MKRAILFMLASGIFTAYQADAQVGKFLKNVKTNVQKDLLGTPDKNSGKTAPEPPCACEPADMVFEVGKYKIDYSELNISVLADGRVLIQDMISQSFYIVKNGVTEGPINESDPRVKQFREIVKNDDAKSAMLTLYKDYISKQGDKYVINFAGKTYGPYGLIDKFVVTRSKEKFAAMVVENVVVTDDEGKKMDEAMKNARTDQEKMELAMKYGDEMQRKIMAGGGPNSMIPKLVSNLPANTSSDYTLSAASFNATMKYDDILLTTESKITDLQGKPIFNLAMGKYDPDNTFISSDNTRYATFSYGTLTISDGKKLSELFNPHLVKDNGKIYLAYMYYSPKRNAIMQCGIPF